MFFKGIKLWFLFGIGTEMATDMVAQAYNYNIFRLEIVKLIIYITCYILLNCFLIVKKADETVILGINCGCCVALASLMGAISFIIILKSEGNIGWILFVLSYIGAIIMCYTIWKKSNRLDEQDEKTEEKPNNVAIKTLGAGSALLSIAFVRFASNDARRVGYTILYIVTLWILLLFCVSVLVKNRNELKNMLTKKNKDSSI